MCWKKIKKWKFWSWLKKAFSFIRRVFAHKKALKVYRGFSFLLIFIMIVSFLSFALISSIFIVANEDLTYQRENIELEMDDYFIKNYNLDKNDKWIVRLEVDTPNTVFLVYFAEKEGVEFIADVPYVNSSYDYYSINHKSSYLINFEVPSSGIWSCIIVNYASDTASFDLTMDLYIAYFGWIEVIYDLVITFSNFWLIPALTIATLAYAIKQLNTRISNDAEKDDDTQTISQSSTSP